MFHSRSVSQFLDKAKKFPLLTPEQEREHGFVIQDYFKLESPTRSETAKFQRSREIMINHNILLVAKIAKTHLLNNSEDLMWDLIQEGVIGLTRAVEKYNPESGYRFSTYAYWWIRQACGRYLKEKNRAIRLPVHVEEQLHKIREFCRRRLSATGCNPSIGEIAEKLKLPEAKVRELLALSPHTTSLNRVIGSESVSEVIELVGAEDDTTTQIDRQMRQEYLAKIIGYLPDRQQIVLRMCYGMAPFDRAYTVQQVANYMGTTRQTVCHLKRKAMLGLRRHKDTLAQFTEIA